MEYKILRINDGRPYPNQDPEAEDVKYTDNIRTATVLMKVGDRELQQDFDLGKTVGDLEEHILKGFSVFKHAVGVATDKAKPDIEVDEYHALVDVTVEVKDGDLPKVPEPELAAEAAAEVE